VGARISAWKQGWGVGVGIVSVFLQRNQFLGAGQRHTGRLDGDVALDYRRLSEVGFKTILCGKLPEGG
jgi:hypothetical protein